MKKYIPNFLPIVFIITFIAVIAYSSGSIFGYKVAIDTTDSDKVTIKDQFTLEEIKKIFSEASSYKLLSEDKAEVFNKENNKIGEVLHTLPISSDIRGFAGAIPMIIGIDTNKQIKNILVLKNNETPAFIERVISTGLLDKWKGKTFDEAAGLKVDAITGATMSSSCIIKSLQTRISGKKAEKDLFSLEDIKRIFVSANSYTKITSNRANVLDSNGQKIGLVLHTFPDCKDLKGFASNIPLIIGMDSKEEITGVVAQENGETPPFFKKVKESGLFNKWNGKIASEAANLKVDAVTGATMSSSCIIKSVKTRLENHIKELEKEKEERRKLYLYWLYEILAWLCLIISLDAYFKLTSFPKIRNVLVIFFVLIPGFMLGRFVSFGLLKSWVSEGIPYSTQIFMTVLVLLAIFLPMITGRAFYCIWYCPFGAAQEVCAMITKKKYTPTGKVAKFLKWTRPVFLTIVLLLILFCSNIDVYQFEPFSAFLFKSASVVVLSLAIVFLILSIFIRRPWCNYFCPTGQFLENCRRKKQ